ncbi:lipoprotein-releasing ABC transporter permease subunit [Thalassotalea mangrovi]|uniref:Lipoprotein-releasing ABC transporter permease subunit n=1 Tax=Thalassotalea mangrovi TaxID=2572245 RepID=A0A4V5NX13_9GAMM|nr:lipoprotein-releasing ABC transporter permease subunit [Thalassotalea mangrovi]TKB44113.1 lipoprotein-releasing ABC transporter permease subunit [Thalassotalea mangrovi]
MFQPVSLFIGLRYSRSQNRSGFVSFITFFSIAGILLGVTALITVVSVMNGFEGQLKKRILGLVPHAVLSAPEPIENWRQVAEQLQANPQVLKATPYLESESLVQSASQLKGVLMQGIFPEYEKDSSIIAENMQVGRLEDLVAGEYNMVIGASLARELDVRAGDKIRLLLPTKTIFTPMGRVPVQRTFTLSGIFYLGSQVDNQMVLIHGQDAARLLRLDSDGVSNIRLYLDDAFRAKELVSDLQVAPMNEEFQFTTWDKTQGNLFAAVKVEKNMMWLMLSLIIAVAAFNIVSALVMVVIDKQGEIGILQTLGMSPQGVLKIFMTQGMVNGIWGTILGCIAGVLVTSNLNSLLSVFGVNVLGSGFIMQQLPVELRWQQVVIILLSALLMSFLATLYPAYRASKTQPAEVLRNE